MSSLSFASLSDVFTVAPMAAADDEKRDLGRQKNGNFDITKEQHVLQCGIRDPITRKCATKVAMRRWLTVVWWLVWDEGRAINLVP